VTRARAGALGALLLALLPAGAALPAAAQPAAPPGAGVPPPVSRQGVLSIEPPRLAIGELARAELVIVTPPGERVVRAPPPEVPGIWVLEAEPLPVEKEPGRWVHRTRFRLRARALGLFVWPTQRVEVERPDGSRQAVTVEGRPIEVVSVLPQFTDRVTPFGLREPADGAAPASGGGLLPGAALGAAGVLAGLAARAAWRRRARGRAPAAAPPAPDGAAPGRRERTLAELHAARELVERDPRGGAAAAAAALRRFAADWFEIGAESSTVEELAAVRPRGGPTPLWSGCLAVLEALDGMRFRPEAGALPPDPRLREALGAAERLLEIPRPAGPP